MTKTVNLSDAREKKRKKVTPLEAVASIAEYIDNTEDLPAKAKKTLEETRKAAQKFSDFTNNNRNSIIVGLVAGVISGLLAHGVQEAFSEEKK